MAKFGSKFKSAFGKDMIAYGAGAGVGIVVPALLQNYVEPTYGPYVPGVDTMLGVWGKWGTFIPIVTGAVALLLPRFAKKLKKKGTKNFLTMYGITSLIVGVVRGAFDQTTVGARAYARPRGYSAPVALRRPAMNAGYQSTPTGISGKVIYS
jgi:hypothetical protein